MKQKILPVGLLLSTIWAILEFSKDRLGRAIYPLAFGAYNSTLLHANFDVAADVLERVAG